MKMVVEKLIQNLKRKRKNRKLQQIKKMTW